MIFRHPEFRSYEQAVEYFIDRVARQKSIILREVKLLKSLEATLDHNKRQLAEANERKVI